MMNAPDKPCRTHLIEDLSSQSDFFGVDGPHSRIARAIASLVLGSDIEGGKVVGLEGSWGAGKTTVVNLLQKQLSADGSMVLHSFDAWAHEGDPLRRVFLESLIERLRTCGWLREDEAAAEMRRLSGKEGKKTTVTKKQTTPFAKVLALAAMLVPLGIPLVVEGLRGGVTIDRSLPVARMFCLGTAMAGAPLVVVLCRALQLLARWLRRKPVSAADWAFLTGEEVTSYDEMTMEHPNPTSIEFEGSFGRIMSQALNGRRKLVVVLDNLDRVDENDAFAVWSTLQTFLQYARGGAASWRDRLWIIIPFDASSLRRMLSLRVPEAAESLADSFIDKSMSVRFVVPQLVVSNWKEFLIGILEEALPDHDADSVYSVYRVFAWCVAENGDAPTPRDMKLFVNQVGAVHRQWTHEFPLDHVAYYVVLQRRKVDVRALLLAGQIPVPGESGVLTILSNGIEESLAGLVHNAPKAVGLQLLLAARIRRALQSGRSDEIAELEARHAKAFWDTIGAAVSARLDTTPHAIAQATMCLEQSGIFARQRVDESSRREEQTLRSSIHRITLGTRAWVPFDKTTADGLVSAMRIFRDQTYTDQLMGNVRHSLRDDNPEEALTSLLSVFRACDELGHGGALKDPILTGIPASKWLIICRELDESDREQLMRVLPLGGFPSIIEQLRETAASGQLRTGDIATLRMVAQRYHERAWTGLVDFIGRRMKSQVIQEGEVAALLEGLAVVSHVGEESADVLGRQLTSQGMVMHHFAGASDRNDLDGQAACIASIFLWNPSGRQQVPFFQSMRGGQRLDGLLTNGSSQIALGIVRFLATIARLPALFDVVDARGKYDKLIVECLRSVGAAETLFTPDAIVSRWQPLRQYLGDEFSALVRAASRDGGLQGHLIAGEFSASQAPLYRMVIAVSSSVEFTQWCTTGMRNVSTRDWETALEEWSQLLELTFELGGGLGVAFQDALLSYAKRVRDQKTAPSSRMIRSGRALVSALDGSSAEVMRDSLVDMAAEVGGRCSDAFFQMFGADIADSIISLKHPGVVRGLLIPLVDGNHAGMAWFYDLLVANPEFLEKQPDKAAVTNLRDRVSARLPSPDSTVAPVLRSIADVLKNR